MPDIPRGEVLTSFGTFGNLHGTGLKVQRSTIYAASFHDLQVFATEQIHHIQSLPSHNEFVTALEAIHGVLSDEESRVAPMYSVMQQVPISDDGAVVALYDGLKTAAEKMSKSSQGVKRRKQLVIGLNAWKFMVNGLTTASRVRQLTELTVCVGDDGIFPEEILIPGGDTAVAAAGMGYLSDMYCGYFNSTAYLAVSQKDWNVWKQHQQEQQTKQQAAKQTKQQPAKQTKQQQIKQTKQQQANQAKQQQEQPKQHQTEHTKRKSDSQGKQLHAESRPGKRRITKTAIFDR